jgi:hypothetical protein
MQENHSSIMVGVSPPTFRTQNVSLAGVGERHHWLWDFHQLQQELEAAGFTGVQHRTSNSSAIPDFPFHPLDIEADGSPRKGAESMLYRGNEAGLTTAAVAFSEGGRND